jgi:3D (Asp-Asp-Asp) domain-containing protein
MTFYIIVNHNIFDIMSTYGRMFRIGEMIVENMKHSNSFNTSLTVVLTVGALLTTNLSMAAFDVSGAESKKITIIDGHSRNSIETNAVSFDKVLSEQHIKLGSHDTYWTSSQKVENGAVIVVERAVPVTIEYKGVQKKIFTTDQTVQGVLNGAGYNWKEVMPMEDGMSKVHAGMVIHVVPYSIKTETRLVDAAPQYVRWYDRSLGSSDEVVVSAAVPGKDRVTVQEYIVDGKVIRSDILGSEQVSAGTPGVMKTGSNVNTVGWVQQMHATAYHPTDGNGEGITATGTRAGYGTIAVDPSVIPLGSTVYIPGYGTAVAADTGGAIVGNRVDLCMETFSECYAFGTRTVDVFVNY